MNNILNNNRLFQWQDIIYGSIWFVIIVFFAFVWKSIGHKKKDVKNYFIPALILRLICGFIGGIITEFYYDGIGDTKGYFLGAAERRYNFENNLQSLSDIFTFYDSTAIVSEFAFPLTYLSNNTYTPITLFFSTFAFAGSWQLYKLFLLFYPNLHKQLSYCILFLPSIFFWGSGLMKDSLSLGGLGFLLYATYNIFLGKKKIITNIIILVLSAWLIYLIKVYILVAAIPSIGIWLSIHFSSQFKSSVIRFLILPLLIIVSLLTAGFILQNLTNDYSSKTSSYNSKNVLQNVKAQQDGYTYGEAGGSYISQGEYDGSISSFITLLPIAVITTFFRPFPWEVKNILMIFSALENFILLYLTLKVFISLGIGQVFSIIKSKPFLIFCVIFSVIFAGFVGASTFNLGTLARYKIPCLPFIWLIVIVLNEKVKEKKIVRKRFLTKELIHG